MDSKPTIDPKHREALESFARARASRRQVLHGAAGLAALGLAGRSRPVVARSAAPSLTPAAISAAQRALRQTADSAQAAVDAANALDPKPAALNVVWEDSSSSGPDTLLRAEVGRADRDQDQPDREAVPRALPVSGRRASRGDRRL